MLNQNRINELKSEVGEDDFDEVVELFFEEMEETLEALSNSEPASRAQLLHFLKGSALNIGFDQLGEICRVEEAAVHADDAHILDFSAIQKTFNDSKAALGV